MTTYKVGTSFTAWSFWEAYSKANDGDILAFEEGYMLELPAGRHYKIEKKHKNSLENFWDRRWRNALSQYYSSDSANYERRYSSV